jgi:hypothetical protein
LLNWLDFQLEVARNWGKSELHAFTVGRFAAKIE